MDWDRVKGDWKVARGKVKAEWGKLTDNDLDVINGDREQLEGRIQALYGMDKQQVRHAVDRWAKESNW